MGRRGLPPDTSHRTDSRVDLFCQSFISCAHGRLPSRVAFLAPGHVQINFRTLRRDRCHLFPRLQQGFLARKGVGVVLQDYGVIAAPQKVEVSLGLPQVPIQAHTGMCEHDRLYELAVTFTEFRCPGRNIVDKGMAVADKKNFHGITPFSFCFYFYDSICTAQVKRFFPGLQIVRCRTRSCR